MDNVGSDRFALEPFGLAFAIQRTVQSRRILSEAKEQLLHDLTKLKEQMSIVADKGAWYREVALVRGGPGETLQLREVGPRGESLQPFINPFCGLQPPQFRSRRRQYQAM